jgi:cytochrome c oxidase assembly protein subunit 15
MRRLQPVLALLITLLALIVVLLGAYTRLTGSGLGCPDWPGCYGQLSVPASVPDMPQAWTEMVHRYVAGALLILVMLQAWLSWREYKWRQPAALIMLAVIAVQAALGMWTVTLKVWPQVVTLHLLGGLTTLGLAYLHWRRITLKTPYLPVSRVAQRLAWLALVALVAQVALGGWASTNHAGAVCASFPGCAGITSQALDFSNSLQLEQPVGPSYLSGSLSFEARAALHMLHRLGALVLLSLTAVLSLVLYRQGLRRHAAALLAVGLGQGVLGAVTALQAAVLPLALAHTAGAAALVLVLAEVSQRLHGAQARAGRPLAAQRWPSAPALVRDAP